MCDKAFDSFLPTLKFVLDCFVTSKMIKKLDDEVFSNGDMVCFNEDSGNVTFCSDEMGISSIGLKNVNLDDAFFDNDDPKTIIHTRRIVWYNRFKQRKGYKKDMRKELMSAASYELVGLENTRRRKKLIK